MYLKFTRNVLINGLSRTMILDGDGLPRHDGIVFQDCVFQK